MLVYTNIYLPKNLEKFLQSFDVYTIVRYIPNVGNDNKLVSAVSTVD